MEDHSVKQSVKLVTAFIWLLGQDTAQRRWRWAIKAQVTAPRPSRL